MIGFRRQINTYKSQNDSINWGHPIARGLLFLAYPDWQHNDLVRNLIGTSNNLQSPKITPFGYGTTGNKNGTYFGASATGYLDLSGSPKLSVRAIVYILRVNNGITDEGPVVGRSSYTNETTNVGYTFAKCPATFNTDGTPQMSFRLYNNNGRATYDLKDTSLTLALGQISHYVGTSDGTTRRIYRDGFERANSANVSVAANSSLGPGIGWTDANDEFYIPAYGFWNRALSAAEVAELFRNPFCLLIPNRYPRTKQISFAQALTETVTHTDTLSRQSTKVRTETITHTDTLIKQDQRSLSETLTHTDTLLKQEQKLLTETVTHTDSLTRQAIKVLKETITHTDTLIRSVSKTLLETLTHTDTLIRLTVKNLTEAITPSDVLLKQIIKNLLETITSSDTLQKQEGKNLTETITLTDFLSRVAVKVLNETLTFTDTLIRQLARIFTESVTLTDVLATLKTIYRTLTETVTLVDTFFFSGWLRVKRAVDATYNLLTRSSDDSYNQSSRSSDDSWNQTPRE